jgi:hypothetical protein
MRDEDEEAWGVGRVIGFGRYERITGCDQS